MAIELEAVSSTVSSPRPLGAVLKIEQHGIEPWRARVWLNGQELTNILGGLDLSFSRDLTKAVLTIYPDDIQVDAETLIHLRAIHDAKNHDD